MTGDTIRSMRLCALVVPVICSACGSDPTLAVTVTHPVGLTVSKTTVTVYESETLHCSDIEFSRLDAVALAALATSEADLDATGAAGALSGISRTDNKVIVARGFDVNDALVSAGCAEKGLVSGADSVAITTLVAAVVSIHPPTDATLDVAITLTDASGVQLPDSRPVTWTVYGPAGSTAANPSNVTSTSDGVWEPALPSCATGGSVLHLRPNPPSILGGYEVQIRVAWAVEQPPSYTSLAAPTFGAVDLGGTVLSTTASRACAIRVAGATKHLVCADNADMAHEYAITVSAGKAIATQVGAAVTALPTPPLTQHVIAVLGVASGTDRNVYAVSDRGILVPLFGAPPPTDTTAQCVACTDAMVVPACNTIGAKILIASTAGSTVHQIDARGGNAMTFDVPSGSEVHLDNAGCVTQLEASGNSLLGQLATVHGGVTVLGEFAASGTFLVNCSTGPCTLLAEVPLTRGAGVGFTTGAEPRIVAATVDATGVVLVSDVFSETGNTIERARMPAASIPEHIVVGQVDTDTDSDLFWNIAARSGATSFEIAYGRKVGADNLEALSPTQGVDVDDLEIGDLTGDGLDDIVVVTAAGVSIIPMGVPIPAPAPNTDATCM